MATNTIGHLRNLCAAYIQVDKSKFKVLVDEEEGETVDIFLAAANNAVRYCQNMFEWEFQKKFVQLTGTSWKHGVDMQGEIHKIHQPLTFYVSSQDQLGRYVPLYHHTKIHGAISAKERLEAWDYVSDRRYLSDDAISYLHLITNPNYSHQYEVYLQGFEFELVPIPRDNIVEVFLDGEVAHPEYILDTDGGESDIFLTEGFEFMQWQCIIELNKLFQTFIPQQEGNLSPPMRARDSALESLVEYNNFVLQTGRQPMID